MSGTEGLVKGGQGVPLRCDLPWCSPALSHDHRALKVPSVWKRVSGRPGSGSGTHPYSQRFGLSVKNLVAQTALKDPVYSE